MLLADAGQSHFFWGQSQNRFRFNRLARQHMPYFSTGVRGSVDKAEPKSLYKSAQPSKAVGQVIRNAQRSFAVQRDLINPKVPSARAPRIQPGAVRERLAASRSTPVSARRLTARFLRRGVVPFYLQG